MIVTELKRKGNNVFVSFNKGDIISVPYDVFLKNYLHVDDELTEKQINNIVEESTLYRIKQSSFRYLTGRNHSKYELKLKLQKKQYNVALILKVLKDLEQQGFVDDEKFANEYYNSLLNRKKGPLQIKANLGKKGVSREIIEAVTSNREDDKIYLNNALIIAEKKVTLLKKRNLDSIKIKQKLFQFLASRGFTTNIIFETIERLELSSDNE